MPCPNNDKLKNKHQYYETNTTKTNGTQNTES